MEVLPLRQVRIQSGHVPQEQQKMVRSSEAENARDLACAQANYERNAGRKGDEKVGLLIREAFAGVNVDVVSQKMPWGR